MTQASFRTQRVYHGRTGEKSHDKINNPTLLARISASLKRAFGDHYVYAGLGTTITFGGASPV